jgi:nucleotide-binding universal stress UspA family protein
MMTTPVSLSLKTPLNERSNVYRKIIIGFDGSEPARDALALGVRLAREADADLLVANVYPLEPLLTSVPASPYQAQLLRDAEHTLASARAALADGPDADFLAVPGASPARALHELAEQEHADLVVVGSCHRGRIGRALIGSNAQKLLQGSPCAVGVAPHGYRRTPRALASSWDDTAVGIAYDGSPEAMEALQAARGTAGNLRVISVVDLGGLSYGYGYGYAEYLDNARELARVEIAEALASLAGRDAKTEIREGAPVTEISAASETLDVLFVGSRSYGPAKRVLLGSVSAQLIEQAACPVIVAPRGAHTAVAGANGQPARNGAVEPFMSGALVDG